MKRNAMTPLALFCTQLVFAVPAQAQAPQLEAPLSALPADERIKVQGFRMVGNQDLASDELLPLLQDAVGQALDLSALQALAQRLTLHYREHGWLVALAYVPQQDFADGIVTLRVVEGEIADVVIENDSGVHHDVVQAMVDQVGQRRSVSQASLERALLILDETPGIDITRADLLPGKRIGASDFIVATVASPRLTGSAALDDFGSAHSGRTRLHTQVAWSPRQRGDQLTLAGSLTSEGMAEYLGLSYSLPLGGNGWRTQLSHVRTDGLTGDRSSDFLSRSIYHITDLALSHPLHYTLSTQVRLSAGVAHKTARDRVNQPDADADRHAHSLYASLAVHRETELLGLALTQDLASRLSFGQVDFNDAAAQTRDAAAAATQGNYAKLELSLAQSLQLTPQLQLSLGASFQRSLRRNNLDAMEHMYVSGMAGVLGYPPNELSNSDVALVHADVARTLGWGELSLFANRGTARAAGHEPAPGRSLGEYGIALQTQLGGLTLQAWWSRLLSGSALTEAPAAQGIHLRVASEF